MWWDVVGDGGIITLGAKAVIDDAYLLVMNGLVWGSSLEAMEKI